jgi:UDP-GlcNAc:undecaprenyl-phosphate GlcNAc-1-phosphate transferase
LDFFRLGLLNWVITACFITFMANSFNMLDGMDGLVAGITSIAAAFFFLLGLMGGQYEIMALSTIVIGSTLGFVVYNFNPASIFLGEAGSTFLGFAMAVLAISMRVHFAWDAPICMGFTNLSCLYFIIPLVILGIPIFDTYFVFINRFFHNLKFSTPGTDHSHHRIHLMGFSQRNTVLILYLVQVVLGLVALVMVHASFYQLIALCGVLLVMVISAAVFLTQVKVYDPS